MCSPGCVAVRCLLMCRCFADIYYVDCFLDGFVCLLLLFKLDCRTCLWFALLSALVVLFVFDYAAINFVCMLYGLFVCGCLLMCVSLCLCVCCGIVFAHFKHIGVVLVFCVDSCCRCMFFVWCY